MDLIKKFEKYSFPSLGLVRLPEVKIDPKQKTNLGLPVDCKNLDLLKKLAWKGFEEKRGTFKKSELSRYKEQLEFEFEIVEELGFTDYFLLVWLVINKAREFGAFIDFGRGSAAASLIFYLIGVTGVDPISKKLIFERFISKVRAKKQVIDGITYLWGELAPDVDLNLGGVRQEIIDWLNVAYQGKISKITAISTLTGKILVKDVYKTVKEVNEQEAKRVADLIDKHFGIVEDIEKMPEKNKEFKKWTEENPEVFEIALKLRGLIRQKSSHASGYLITFQDLYGYVPLELNREKELTVSYEMDDVAHLGIKLDLLGLTSNEIIKDVMENIPETVEDIIPHLDDDPLIYDQFQAGNLLPYGLYQISADCAYRVLQEIKPKNIFELSDVNAIARPGALAYQKDYVKNETPCPHTAFEKTLKWTRNFCLYQEQMMEMAVSIGFTRDEAELLRRVVGKKKVDEVKEWKARIYTTCEKNGFEKTVGDLLWKILDDSSKYSFNLSHSLATSYLSALTVYLKYKFPLQFYVACLRAAKKLPNPIEEVALIQSELKQFGIKLLPPHILKSHLDFSIEGSNIRFGLGQIKGIAEKTIHKLNDFKHDFSNKFEIFQAANEAKISISVLTSLILVGAMDDEINESRSRVVLEAQLWGLLTPKEKALAMEHGKTHSYNLTDTIKYIHSNCRDEKGRPLIKDSRIETLRKNYAPYVEMYKYNKKNEAFAQYYFENKLLGFSHSVRLMDVYRPLIDDIINVDAVKNSSEDDRVHFVAKVIEVKEGIAKNEKKTRYLRLTAQDETGQCTVMIFNDAIDEHESDNKRKVQKEDIIVVRGNWKGDAVFARKIGIQDVNIFMRLSEMKNVK